MRTMVVIVPNTPRYFTVDPVPVAAEPLASPWTCPEQRSQKVSIKESGFGDFSSASSCVQALRNAKNVLWTLFIV